MSDPISTVRLDETHRVQVYIDDSPANPRSEWEQQTGALTVNGDSRTLDVEPCFEFPGRLQDAHDRLYDRGGAYWAEKMGDVQRWARIFHGIEIEYVDGTYWWVPPEKIASWTPVGEYEGRPLYRYGAAPELITADELQHRIIRADREGYEQWARGDVFGLTIERFELEVSVKVGLDEAGEPISLDEYLPSGDSEEYWNETESVWGFYINAWDDEEVRREACSIAGLTYVPSVKL